MGANIYENWSADIPVGFGGWDTFGVGVGKNVGVSKNEGRGSLAREIDQQVDVLYLPAPRFAFPTRQAGGLTPEEIKIVEESSK